MITHAAAKNGMRVRSPAAALEQPPLRIITVQALKRWLDPLAQLYAMRRQINAEAIPFKPFPRGAARIAAVKGVGVQRTPIPPPRLALHLLQGSIDWIIRHDPTLGFAAEERKNVFHMATACWIVIAAFTARRDGEISDLRSNCLRGDEKEGWWLYTYIEKTMQRRDWIPIPGVVARAVQVLEKISSAARRKDGSDEIFQWLNSDDQKVHLNISRHLDDFAELVQVPLHRAIDSPEQVWHWHPHQFRRFFAVLYFYRYEEAKIEALSHHLRHFNLEMTRRYVTQDPEVAAIWLDVEWGYMGHVARSIVSGERSVSGAAGERLKRAATKLTDAFRRKVQITSPERIGASLSLVMQRQGMVLRPKPWVTCTCPRTREAAETASCRRGRSISKQDFGPDFAFAGPTVCAVCPHAMTEGGRRETLEAELEHLQGVDASRMRDNTVFNILERARVIALQDVHETRYKNSRTILPLAPKTDPYDEAD